MQKLLLLAIICLASGTSCRIFSHLHSTTTIEPARSFVLGEGNHGSYEATVKNISKQDIEVFISDKNAQTVSLGLLSPKVSKTYKVASNTKVAFKNLGNATAYIEIELVGDTQLSMGYKDNSEIKAVKE